jgi:uncharacterized SAM-binding protein YcdF (DUF218 family)
MRREETILQTPSRLLWGAINRKERWGLSRRGWLVCVFLGSAAFFWFLFGAHSFLSISQPANTDILVVEGWVHEYAIVAALQEFKKGHYQRILTTGGPVSGLGHYINDYQTAASVGAARLRKIGIPEDSLQMVPSHVMSRDRTYASAVALREWFREHDLAAKNLNVLTENVHARRTRLLFQKALGNDVLVGIIAVPNPDYDSKHWWQYSEGVKDVISEGTAYVYARLCFYPSVPQHGDKGAVASQSDNRQ